MNFDSLYKVIETNTEDFVYRNFDEFNYLEVDPPTWEIWTVYILTIAITIWLLWYGYQNEYESEEVIVNLDDECEDKLPWVKKGINSVSTYYKKMRK